ncbi:hypothetical protein MKQ68_18825 [Chitinophaga horti]|uniref:Uncharacterized protein n=1 Tax=Chitinophaga horti TaxID=2920382 RepID=A0ABY6IXN0_9BACT|nr:hypothetical protein [Chitinophaga horti]UYQ92145.1 hypothetical protein MKQ68_18825 [Chitinophaga horti]
MILRILKNLNPNGSSMERCEKIGNFLGKLAKDQRIGVYHLVMMLAILNKWQYRGTAGVLMMSRRTLMQVTKIRSIATYHKYLKELQEFGYVEYFASYHPRLGSGFFINFEVNKDMVTEV